VAPRTRTPELYQALVRAFREGGENLSYVSRAVKCSRGMARVAFSEGWTEYHWAPPIRDVLSGQKRAARAVLAVERVVTGELEKRVEQIRDTQIELHDDQRTLAVQQASLVQEQTTLAQYDAVVARVADGKAVRAAKAAGGALLDAFERVARVTAPLAERAAELLETMMRDAMAGESSDDRELAARRVVNLIDKLASAGVRLNEQYRSAMAIEEIHLGMASAAKQGPTLTFDEALHVAEVAVRAIERAQARMAEQRAEVTIDAG
jgi:hypothetical protein